jgi:hypothetical protein
VILARAVLVLSLLGLAGAVPAAAQTAPAPGRPAGAPAPTSEAGSLLASLVDQVLGFFPVAEGEVVEARGAALTLDVGQGGGMRPGLVISLYRQGREIKHPKSGQVLGRVEEPLGQATVVQVQPGLSFARVAEGAAIQAGDRFRISADREPIGLLTFNEGIRESVVEAAVHEIVERLGASRRFRVVLGDAGRAWLEQRGIGPEALLGGRGVKEVSEQLKVGPLLVVHFRRLQGRPYMDVRMFSPPQPDPLVTSGFFVPASVRSAATPGARFSAGGAATPPVARPRSLLARLLGGDLEPNTYSSGESSIPLREIARFPFPVVAMDTAVAPRDKAPRLAVSDSWTLYLYRVAGQKVEPEWSISVRRLGRVISIQLADLDGDGALEVIGNRFDSRGGLNAFIVTAPEGRPRIAVDDVTEFLYAVDARGEGVRQTLWAQRFSPETFFTPGQADLMSFKGGKLTTERPARVPPRFRPMGATFSNIGGKDTRSLVSIDEFNRLQISADAQEVWSSSSPVGGGLAVAEQEVWEGRDRRSRFYKIEPTPLAVDLDGDGIEEVVVPQNTVKPGVLGVVFRGPAGYRMQSIDSGFEGNITGLGGFRNPEDSAPTLIAAVVRYSNFLKLAGETQIIMTLPPD